MSDDAAVAAENIPLEDGDGASTPLPPELVLPADPAAATPPAGEAPPGETPPANAPPLDPAKAGILAELGRERHENKTLKQFRDQAAPILQALQKHPDLLLEIQQRESGTPRSAPPAGAPPRAAAPVEPAGPSVEDLTQLATDLVLYKADGSGLPDVDAARRIWQRNQQQVQQAVQQAIAQHVAPMQQTLTRSTAQQAREAIEQTAKSIGADGPELTQILDGFMQSDPGLLSNPQIGVSAIVMARGMKGMPTPGTPGTGPGPAGGSAGPAPAPVFTERPGGRPAAPVTLAPIEQRAAKARGMTPEAWGAAVAPLTTAVKGQQHIILEND